MEKCRGTNCPIRSDCKRYADYMGGKSIIVPYNINIGTCEFKIKVKVE